MRARRLSILIGCALLTSSLLAQESSDRILNAQKEPQNWQTYSGTYMSQRYSQLTQITPANVKDLELAWDSAEAGLKPRDPKDWRLLDGEIDGVLTSLRASSPTQADCASNLDTLAKTLSTFDGV